MLFSRKEADNDLTVALKDNTILKDISPLNEYRKNVMRSLLAGTHLEEKRSLPGKRFLVSQISRGCLRDVLETKKMLIWKESAFVSNKSKPLSDKYLFNKPISDKSKERPTQIEDVLML